MVDYRKLILGVVYMLSSTFLVWQGIRAGVDMMQLSTPIGAMGVGMFGVIWGNVKEHESIDKKEDCIG